MSCIRIFIFSFFVMTLIIPAFIKAEEAFMLPANVFRWSHALSRTTVDKEYDSAGKKRKLGTTLDQQAQANGVPGAEVNPKSTVFRYDFVAEYGVTDTLGVQAWIPFYLSGKAELNPNSKMDIFSRNAPSSVKKLSSEDGKAASVMGDALLGIKWQFLNTASSPLNYESNTWRMAIAGGFYVPTGKPAAPDSNNISTSQVESKSWIAGVRTYVDYQAVPWFYVNFFTEHQYRLKGKRSALSKSAPYDVVEGKFQPGSKHIVEFDFVLHPDLNETTRLESGFAMRGIFERKGKYSDFTDSARLNGTYDPLTQLYIARPYIGVFTTKGLFPSKLTLGYDFPVAGKNSYAYQTVYLIWRGYFKFL